MNEKKILIVEDDPDNAELIIDELNTEDIREDRIVKELLIYDKYIVRARLINN